MDDEVSPTAVTNPPVASMSIPELSMATCPCGSHNSRKIVDRSAPMARVDLEPLGRHDPRRPHRSEERLLSPSASSASTPVSDHVDLVHRHRGLVVDAVVDIVVVVASRPRRRRQPSRLTASRRGTSSSTWARVLRTRRSSSSTMAVARSRRTTSWSTSTSRCSKKPTMASSSRAGLGIRELRHGDGPVVGLGSSSSLLLSAASVSVVRLGSPGATVIDPDDAETAVPSAKRVTSTDPGAKTVAPTGRIWPLLAQRQRVAPFRAGVPRRRRPGGDATTPGARLMGHGAVAHGPMRADLWARP